MTPMPNAPRTPLKSSLMSRGLAATLLAAAGACSGSLDDAPPI